MATERQRPRRSKGTGSVYKRPDGKFEGRADFGWRDGRRWRPKVVAATQRLAQQRLAQLIADHATGALVEPSRETVGSFLERWLDTVQRPRLEPSSYLSQAGIIRRHLIPAFGARPLAKLTTPELQAYFAHARTLKRQRPLAPTTLRTHLRVLRHALGTAVRWRLLRYNPAADVVPPKVSRGAPQALDWDAAARFLGAVADDRLAALYLVGLATGLRIGECLGLQWAAVDLDGARLHVRRKLLYVERDLLEGPPKTDAGRRTVELHPVAVAALRTHQARQAAEQAAAPCWARPDLVFTSPLGEPLRATSITSHELGRLCRQAGLPPVTFRALRHSFASLLLAEGAPLNVVQELLGHASPMTTATIYREVLRGEKRGAVQRLDRLFGALRSPNGLPVEGESEHR